MGIICRQERERLATVGQREIKYCALEQNDYPLYYAGINQLIAKYGISNLRTLLEAFKRNLTDGVTGCPNQARLLEIITRRLEEINHL